MITGLIIIAISLTTSVALSKQTNDKTKIKNFINSKLEPPIT